MMPKKTKPDGKVHTELRRQDEAPAPGPQDAARTPLKPRAPVARQPVVADDEDELFNDLPV